MQLSIIIVNYNTFQLTCNCINSVIRHTKAVNYEIILVDNNSTERIEKNFETTFPGQLYFLKSEKNLGFAGGNNLGIRHAKGEYILLLNSDTELLEDSISKTYYYAKTIDNLGAITCKLLNPDQKSFQNAARPFYSVRNHLIKTLGLKSLLENRLRKNEEKYNLNRSFQSDWIWGTFFMFPYRNLNLIGGKLSETFFMYSEDVEWCYIFKQKRLQNHYFADTAIVHHIGKSSNSIDRKKAIKESHLVFLRKYRGGFIYFLEVLLFFVDDLVLYFRKIFKKFVSIFK